LTYIFVITESFKDYNKNISITVDESGLEIIIYKKCYGQKNKS